MNKRSISLVTDESRSVKNDRIVIVPEDLKVLHQPSEKTGISTLEELKSTVVDQYF